jgi:hypothetical protein
MISFISFSFFSPSSFTSLFLSSFSSFLFSSSSSYLSLTVFLSSPYIHPSSEIAALLLTYYSSILTFFSGREGSVGMTRLRVERSGFDSRQGLGIFSSPKRPDDLWGTPNLLTNG